MKGILVRFLNEVIPELTTHVALEEDMADIFLGVDVIGIFGGMFIPLFARVEFEGKLFW